VVRILTRAKDRSRPAETTVLRTPAQWKRFKDLVRELVDLLIRLGLHQPSQDEAARSSPSKEDAAGDPFGQWLARVSEALAQQGRDSEAGGGTADSDDWIEVIDHDDDDDDDLGWCDDDENQEEDENDDTDSIFAALVSPREPIRYDVECYNKVLPAFRQTCRTFEIGRTIAFEEGHRSGGRLSRPYRALIDGKCFRRICEEQGPEGAVAILFDHSDSMADSLGVFLPVGVALADALKDAGFEVAVWRFGGGVERMQQIHDLERPKLMGSTRTDLALGEARTWFEGRMARHKLIVLFTDGEPNDHDAMREQTVQIRRLDIELIFGSLGMGREQCEELAAAIAPWALTFDVDPGSAASSLQVVLKRIGRRADV
jgi:hypothetical protein